AHRRGQLGVDYRVAVALDAKDQVFAEDLVELVDAFDGNRNVERTGCRESHEGGDVHPRERRRQRRSPRLERNARLRDYGRCHRGVTLDRCARTPAPALRSPHPCPWPTATVPCASLVARS